MTVQRLLLDKYDARLKTPFATLGLVASETHLLHIHFLPMDVIAKAPKPNTIAHLASVQLMAYLDNPAFEFDLPLMLSGSKHQVDVWQAMRNIKAGATQTYGELSSSIDSSPRAVGTACGQNPVPIVVPCHRVVAANSLGGFMGGKKNDSLTIKRWLLAHESAHSETSLF